MNDLLNFNKMELIDFITGLGEPKYRADQIFAWLHRGTPIDQMSDLSKKTREKLKENSFVNFPIIDSKLVSKIDGTVKYLFRLADGQLVESVVMNYKHGNTVCISCQAGCRMGCKFCASTLNGLSRNLEPSEMLGQVIAAQNDIGERISNVVLMGIGEPLDNYNSVIKFLKNVNSEGGLNIGYRHISLSTCGLADKILKLAGENLPVTLSVSLHASTDAERSALMPINNKWCIAELLSACKEFFEVTGRRISFEYTLIKDKNDNPAHAEKLADVLHRYIPGDIPIHVNLIPVNEVKEIKEARDRGFRGSSRDSVDIFESTLLRRGINTTVRRKLGADIDASCGQLRYRASQPK